MIAPARLFDGPAPRLRAVPASAPFLTVLADALVAELVHESDPFALSDALVLLPNRRAAAGLIDAFAERLGGSALLPAIRPLGDPHVDDDPDIWGADALTSDILPPIEPMQRRLELASLIRRRDAAENGVEDPARAIALADELARLLDSAATVDRVAWEKLPTLVEEIELARHWGSAARFLEIISAYWPLHLSEQGLSDFADHGAQLRRALAARWRENAPARPIIIAGSTGSIATTRELMRVVAGLPRGVVVFPGVDVDMDESAWALIGDQHPQHALQETLKALGVERGDIPLLALENAHGRARRVLMREALAPAEQTADWLGRLEAAGGGSFVAAGAAGLCLVEAATEDEEAAAIALLLREALEQDGATAAVVTPDKALARRIESKLVRWGVQPVISHGSPLRETEAGVLVALLCELAQDPGAPVALAGLLKHPRVTVAGAELAVLERKALRGPRRHDTLRELAALPELQGEQQARDLIARVEQALAPLAALAAQNETTLEKFTDAVALAAENVSGGSVWQGADGEAAAQVLRGAITYGARLGALRGYAAPRVMQRLMDGLEVPPARGGDSRVAIWGPLEARLQRRDLMILAGLNEGVWPAPPPEDPFLSRGMRERLGLPSLDQRIGLAAHDFAQLANAPRVVLTRALRREGAPTLASRWLWRLKTLMHGAGAALESADRYAAWAHALDASAAPRRPRIPKPCPSAGKRLTQISVTQVETLIRDPYAVYARRILGLEHLKPLAAPPGPAERGQAVHKAIERFGDGRDEALLAALLDEELRLHGISAERRVAERERLRASVAALIAWFAARSALGAVVYRERRGELMVDGVKLTGIADRIEIGASHAAILDFKTGAPPTNPQVESGLAPQLPLEAAMLARGAFADVPKAQATELGYFRFGGSDPTPKPLTFDAGAHAAGEATFAALRGLLAHYADPAKPFLSKPRVQFIKPYAEYDHLARRKEWADAEGGE
jgi:ATP-dependent helicase/nuclease subunit B